MSQANDLPAAATAPVTKRSSGKNNAKKEQYIPPVRREALVAAGDGTLTREEVSSMIAERVFDPTMLPTLEQYLSQQLRDGTYDFAANRHILKLYLHAPAEVNINVVAVIFLKALTELPATDFLACSYLLNWRFQELEPMRTIFKLSNMIESGMYPKFWQTVEQHREVVDMVPNFDAAMRRFITSTIAATFQNAPVESIASLLNVKPEDLASVAPESWTIADGIVTVPVNADNASKNANRKQTPIENMMLALQRYS